MANHAGGGRFSMRSICHLQHGVLTTHCASTPSINFIRFAVVSVKRGHDWLTSTG